MPKDGFLLKYFPVKDKSIQASIKTNYIQFLDNHLFKNIKYGKTAPYGNCSEKEGMTVRINRKVQTFELEVMIIPCCVSAKRKLWRKQKVGMFVSERDWRACNNLKHS